jgi:putative addiction module component (TIGR02574 family)
MSVDAILEQVTALTTEERARFRARLDDEFPADEVNVSPELGALLDARAAAADADPNVGYTMEEVVAFVKRKK